MIQHGIQHSADATHTVDNNSQFTITATSRAFRILSDGLYSDKIRAVIRELSCNARDSHVAAGNSAPWEMHLPTVAEPWFSITDFGTGLSDADITSVYTRYFVSTKTTSNEFVGQLGLGSKSPFCYTSEFFVTSRHGGVEYQYRMYFDATETPRVERLGHKPTTGTGLTVKFAAHKDFDRWKGKAHQVLQWFTQVPVQTGAPLVISTTPCIWKGTGWRVWEKKIWDGDLAQAQMGGVIYPIKFDDIPNISDDYRSLLMLPIVIDFDIGDLDVAASREGLSYDTRTSTNIINKVSDIFDELKAYVWDKIESQATVWDARIQYGDMFSGVHGVLISSLYNTFAKPICNGVAIKSATITVLNDDLMEVGAASIGFMFKGKKSSVYKQHYSITANRETKIVYNDLKRGGASRIKLWHTKASDEHITVILPYGSDKAAISNLLGNPPLVLSSELTAIPTKAKATPAQLWEFVAWEYGKKAWRPVGPYAILPEIRYYVILDMWDAYVDGKYTSNSNLSETINAAQKCKLFTDTTKVYGIRRAQFDKLTDKSALVSLNTPIMDYTNKVLNDPAFIKSIVDNTEATAIQVFLERQGGALRTLNHNDIYRIKYKLRDQSSDIVKFYEGVRALDSNKKSIIRESMETFCKWSGLSIPAHKFNPDLLMLGEHVVVKYRMLRHLSYYNSMDANMIDDVVNYIDAVDTAYTFNILTKEEPELTV